MSLYHVEAMQLTLFGHLNLLWRTLNRELSHQAHVHAGHLNSRPPDQEFVTTKELASRLVLPVQRQVSRLGKRITAISFLQVWYKCP